MKRFLPIILVIIILGAAGYFVLKDDSSVNNSAKEQIQKSFIFEEFEKPKSCSKLPMFLYKAGIKRPVIDLSQENYTGIAFYYGKKFNKVLHKKEWEKYDYMGTYAIDKRGNIYLAPNPFISIKPTTFNLQKALYKMNGATGELTRWMIFDDIKPNQNNPYGIVSVAFDCQDNTLWLSAIDKSNYKGSNGRIYQIDPKRKEILQKIDAFDALTIAILPIKEKKYLLAGSAMDNGLYAFDISNKALQKPIKLLSLPNPNLHIRKIKVIDKNTLKLEAIKFNYSLIAQSAKKQRVEFIAKYNPASKKWQITNK